MGSTNLDRRTVFVRNVDFNASQAVLEELFGNVGPVRSCFLVKRTGDKHHKGYGYVQFAIPDDAQRATEELNGHIYHGRALQVEIAQKRAPLAERKRKVDDPASHETEEAANRDASKPSKLEPVSKKQKAQQQETGISSLALPPNLRRLLIRTVALAGLSPSTTAKAIELAQAVGKVEQVVAPAPEDEVERYKLQRDGATGDIVFVVYDTVKNALQAVTQLHRQSVSPGDAADPEGTVNLWARQVAGEAAHYKKWKLIVRNLPFNVTNESILDVFQSVGFVWELVVPRTEEGKSRGFCFVGYTSRGIAQKAINTLNGQKVCGRPIAVDWAVAKQQFETTEEQQRNKQHKAEDSNDEENENKEENDAIGGGKCTQSTSHDDASIHDDDDEDGQGMGGGVEEEGPEGERERMKKMLDSFLEEVQQDQGGGVAAEPKKAKRKAEAVRQENPDEKNAPSGPPTTAPTPDQQQQPEGDGRTVFIRGLPLDATRQQLQARLQTFGAVSACRVVKEKVTGVAKGTAFVEFVSPKDAAAAAEGSQKARNGGGPAIIVCGRPILVDLALRNEALRDLAANNANSKPDRRNLYLAKEGQILEGSAAWAGLSTTDKAKRKRAAEEKNMKLKSPNFFVSKTRLSVRNIPKNMDEKALKKMFIQAVKSRASRANPIIKQIKLLRDDNKLDAEGNAKSRGLGFVEFQEHEHALCALRQLNNHPDVFTRDARPIVEFSLENVKVVKIREARLAKQQQWQANKKTNKDSSTTRQTADNEASNNSQQFGSKQHDKDDAPTGQTSTSEPGKQQQQSGAKKTQHSKGKKKASDDVVQQAEQPTAVPEGAEPQERHRRRKYRRKGRVQKKASAKEDGQRETAAQNQQNGKPEGGATKPAADGKAETNTTRQEQKHQPRAAAAQGRRKKMRGNRVGDLETVRQLHKAGSGEHKAGSRENKAGSGEHKAGSGEPRGRKVSGKHKQPRPADGSVEHSGAKRRLSGPGMVDIAATGQHQKTAKRQKKDNAKTDGLDTMVAEYKAKYFGGEAAPSGKANTRSVTKALRRWFE